MCCVVSLLLLAGLAVSLAHPDPSVLHRAYGTQVRQVVNGELSCGGDTCVLTCDVGYVSAGRAVFDMGQGEEEAQCVAAMAFIVGEKYRPRIRKYMKNIVVENARLKKP